MQGLEPFRQGRPSEEIVAGNCIYFLELCVENQDKSKMKEGSLKQGHIEHLQMLAIAAMHS